MNYVESFNLLGVEAKQIPCIRGEGEPTTETEGTVGCLYMDTLTGNTYKCTAVESSMYTWVVQDIDVTQATGDSETAVMSQKATTEAIANLGFVSNTSPFAPVNILEGVTLTKTEGASWSSSGVVVSNSNTTKYTAINEKIDVIAGHTYKIPRYMGVARCVYEDGTVGSQMSFINGTSATDREITIPEGANKLVLAYLHGMCDFTEMYRLTPTAEELKVTLKNDKFSMQKCNISDAETKDLLCPLKDKVIVNFGDSIFGNYDAPTDISSMLANLTGATVHNCGFGGTRMASHATSYYDAFSMYRLADAIVTRDFALQDQAIIDGTAALSPTSMLVTKYPTRLALLKTIDFNKVDIITIAYGTNDHTGYPRLDKEDSPLHTDYIAGALRYSIEKLLTTYPHLKIFVCSPLYRCWNNADGTLNYDSDTHIVNNVLLIDVINKEKAVAEEYHLPFINNYNIGINKVNRLNYFTVNDGAHPNLDGLKLIAEHIASELY